MNKPDYISNIQRLLRSIDTPIYVFIDQYILVELSVLELCDRGIAANNQYGGSSTGLFLQRISLFEKEDTAVNVLFVVESAESHILQYDYS